MIRSEFGEARDSSCDVPKGWVVARMDDAGLWATGGTPSRKVESYFGGDIPWVKSGDLGDGLVNATEEMLSEEGLSSSAAKLLPQGTLSVALYGATIGRLGILGIDAATNQACANCIVHGKYFNRWYLFYYLLAQRTSLVEAGQGGAQPNLTNRIVREWPLLLPPLAEQERIVAKVEALLGRVNEARERLARVPAILKRFRQSVLAAACSGQLTADWREENPDVKPAISNEEDSAALDEWGLGDVADGWCWTTLRDVTDYQGGHAYKSKRFVDENTGNQVLRIGNVRPGYIGESIAPAYIDNDYAQEAERFQVQPDDILISQTGTRYKRDYGYVGLIQESTNRLFLNQRVSRLRCSSKRLLPQYLFLWLQSEEYRECFFKNETGNVNQGNVGATPLKTGPIALPPFAEQQELARRAITLFEISRRIEQRLTTATAQTERITQSVLAKAFSGELVEAEADLARREGRDYEPASVLLARIAADRETASKKPT